MKASSSRGSNESREQDKEPRGFRKREIGKANGGRRERDDVRSLWR
ncbi:hypothetical protein chiPu_0027372, partial [Chiloscyllium punctatum]|nr:hypothetical protein [Chiloscyllium punctatum]